MRKKKVFFQKQLSKFWASNNLGLQIKQSLQNKTTDHNNYTYTETILLTQIYLGIRDRVNLKNSTNRLKTGTPMAVQGDYVKK